MIPSLTKSEIRIAITRLLSLAPPGPRALTAAELVEVNDLIEKLRQIGAAQANAPERGRLVLSWRVPREHAPTLNQYAQMKGWAKKKLRTTLDDALRTILPAHPHALLHGSQLRRWLRVTRFSTKRVDEVSVDLLGGKMCVDSLKRVGVIADDDEKHVHREPRIEKCKPGETHVLVEVFEMASEQVAAAEPAFAKVQQVVRVPGIMTKAIIDGMPR